MELGAAPSSGYVFIATVTNFSQGRLPEIPEETAADHSILSEITRYYFPPENTITLNNPSCSEFNKSLIDLSKKCQQGDFLFVYISTHFVTLMGHLLSLSSKEREICLLTMKDTLWTRPAAILQTCISLQSFIDSLNKIACAQKTLILNYVHNVEPPRRTIFASKYIYPPSNCIFKLAEEAKCAVITSCCIGGPIEELQRYLSRRTATVDKTENKVTSGSPSELRTEEPTSTSISALGIDVSSMGPNDLESDEENRSRLLREWRVPDDEEIEMKPFSLRINRVQPSPKWERNNNSSFISDQPRIKVAIAAPRQVKAYRKNSQLTSVLKTIFIPLNWVIRARNAHKRRGRLSPLQRGLVLQQQYSLFGKAVADALVGGASSPDSDFVTAEMLFKSIEISMKENVALISPSTRVCLGPATFPVRSNRSEREGGSYKKEEDEAGDDLLASVVDIAADETVTATAKTMNAITSNNDETELVADANASPETHKMKAAILAAPYDSPTQVPLFIVPPDVPEVTLFRVCVRCQPPPPPEKPYIIHVARTSVTLQWYNPTSDGYFPATKYMIQVRAQSRCGANWQPIAHLSDIVKSMFQVNRLAAGVACQFRVLAYNNGGWSEPSRATRLVTPGDDLTPPSVSKIWAKLSHGGLLSVVDRLLAYPMLRQEQHRGLRKVLVSAQGQGGPLSRGMVAAKVTTIALNALRVFPDDLELIPIIIELLGWCIRSHANSKAKGYQVFARLVDADIEGICDHFMDKFRQDTRIIGAISWLRGNLTTAGRATDKEYTRPSVSPVPPIKDKEKEAAPQGEDSDLSDAENDPSTER